MCNRGLWNPWLIRLRSQGIPYVAVNLEPAFGGIDDYLPIIESAIHRLRLATGRAPVVVAHSMGGLAVQRWWTQPGNTGCIAHLIAIGTPFNGTWLARFAMSRNARQMQPGSPWLEQLSAEHAKRDPVGITCFYSNTDNIVFPVSSATLSNADNRLLPGVPHVAMVDDLRAWAELLRRLSP